MHIVATVSEELNEGRFYINGVTEAVLTQPALLPGVRKDLHIGKNTYDDTFWYGKFKSR